MRGSAASRLAARVATDYQLGGHRLHFIPDLNDVAEVAQLVSFQYTATVSAGDAAENSLAAILALAGGLQAIGPSPLGLVRAIDLGTAAFADANVLRGRPSAARGAAYQMLPQDFGLTLIAESGTLTWTLPLLSALPFGWYVAVWNRSGANLTINRAGSDVIGAAATSLTVATATGAVIGARDATRFELLP